MYGVIRAADGRPDHRHPLLRAGDSQYNEENENEFYFPYSTRFAMTIDMMDLKGENIVISQCCRFGDTRIFTQQHPVNWSIPSYLYCIFCFLRNLENTIKLYILICRNNIKSKTILL